MTTRTYPARCQTCGAAPVGTLASDHGVPIYACGSWGSRSTHPDPLDLEIDAGGTWRRSIANVTWPTYDELEAIDAMLATRETRPTPLCACIGCQWRRTHA